MRRFVQALSGYEGFPGLPMSAAAIFQGASLRNIPDRYNIGIRMPATVLLLRGGHWELQEMRWGLVPSWEEEAHTKYSTQTARLRNAPTSRMFRRAWQARRCAIPMNGYYKWDRERRPPWPYFIQSARGFMLFAAGLWERWENETGQLDSFAVLTYPSTAIPRPLTPDGPVFLSPSRLHEWLVCDASRAMRVALAARQPELEAYPVSRRIASREVDDYTLLEPATPTDEADSHGAEDAAELEKDEDDP